MTRFTPESSRKKPQSIGDTRGGVQYGPVKVIITTVQLAGILLMTRVAMYSMGIPLIGIPIVDHIAVKLLTLIKYNLPASFR